MSFNAPGVKCSESGPPTEARVCLCLQEGGAARGGDGGRHHGLLPVAGFGSGRRPVVCLQGPGVRTT